LLLKATKQDAWLTIKANLPQAVVLDTISAKLPQREISQILYIKKLVIYNIIIKCKDSKEEKKCLRQKIFLI
jgi:hypothetical protein